MEVTSTSTDSTASMVISTVVVAVAVAPLTGPINTAGARAMNRPLKVLTDWLAFTSKPGLPFQKGHVEIIRNDCQALQEAMETG